MPVPEAMMAHLLRSATIAQGLGLEHIFTKKARLPTVRPRSGATCCDARRQPGTCLVDRYLPHLPIDSLPSHSTSHDVAHTTTFGVEPDSEFSSSQADLLGIIFVLDWNRTDYV